MRRITLWLMTTLGALALLLSYRTSTAGVDGVDVAGAAAPAGAASTTTSQGTTSTEDPTSSTNASGAVGTFTGDAVDTRWGPVQVEVTVQDGQVTDVQAVVYPTENHRDVEINAGALPQLRQEVLTAQSAEIDTISGATVTSDGYIGSLQSALDAAGLG